MSLCTVHIEKYPLWFSYVLKREGNTGITGDALYWG